ncbi:MAG: sulfotransferase domain-containing protein [Bacteroidetes bacterium]|nr:sulfotransferase domain-containing protein [Bacteroidota bacterium]
MKNLVWLASYPRSGNTWFRIFLSNFLSGFHGKDLNHLEIDQLASSRNMFDELAGLRASELTVEEIRNLRPVVYQLLSEQSENPVYLKSHDRFYITPAGDPLFPPGYSYGCVYFIRNPLDVVVSNALYFGKPVDEIILALNNPGQTLHTSNDSLKPLLEEWLGSWSDHVTSWLNSGIRVHIIRYEDMLACPVQTFTNALRFLNLSFSEEQVWQAVSETSFETLKKSEAEFGFKEKLQKCESFFRYGKEGTWKTFLNELQVKRITSEHHHLMARFGYLEPAFDTLSPKPADDIR